MKYYGEDGSEEGDDKHAADAVVEACVGMNDQIDFTQYDSDNDGYVDFVYVIYAGEGQATGGPANSIWPHNWDITAAISYGYCTYTNAQRTLDGKKIDNYAISGELFGGTFGGIGTLVHEFGHVIGLPDFYDTEYGTNYDKELTPNEWDVMDGGSYNGDGHCPPNYSPWEKYFMGWLTPENLGNKGARLTLYPNGTEQHNVYQINESGKLQSATTNGLSYYIECRQKAGWDKNIPAAGMLIWKTNFNASAWAGNTPNNTANNPKYTLVIPSGTKIGQSSGSKNVWPYGTTNSWEGVSGKPLKEITKVGNNIELIYIEEPADPVYTVTWMVDGEVLETAEYALDGSEDLVLPTKEVTPCEGTEFAGWTAESEWMDPFSLPEDLFTEPTGKVTENLTFHALFK